MRLYNDIVYNPVKCKFYLNSNGGKINEEADNAQKRMDTHRFSAVGGFYALHVFGNGACRIR